MFHLYFVAIVFCYICILAICILFFCFLSCLHFGIFVFCHVVFCFIWLYFVLFVLWNICILSRIPCNLPSLKGASRLNQCLSYIVQNGTLICRNIFIFCSGRIKAFRLHHLVIKNTLRTLTFDSLDLHPLPLWTFTHHYSADLHFNLESPFKDSWFVCRIHTYVGRWELRLFAESVRLIQGVIMIGNPILAS